MNEAGSKKKGGPHHFSVDPAVGRYAKNFALRLLRPYDSYAPVGIDNMVRK